MMNDTQGELSRTNNRDGTIYILSVLQVFWLGLLASVTTGNNRWDVEHDGKIRVQQALSRHTLILVIV